VHLTADNVAYDEVAGVALAEGNVELAVGNRSMKADRIRYDYRSGEAEFAGQCGTETRTRSFPSTGSR